MLRRAAPLWWFAATLPLVSYAAVFWGSVGAILGVVGQLGLACLLALVPLPRRALRLGLLVTLTLLVAGGVAERELSKHSWQGSDKAGLWSALGLGHAPGTVSGYGFRNWNAAGVAGEEVATVQLEVRLVSGQPAWDWFRSDEGFVLEPQAGRDYPHTRVQVPVIATGQPYLMRTFDIEEPLAGRIFRVLLDLRRAPDAPVDAAVAETPVAARAPSASDIVSGSPVGGRDCQGVLLQAWTKGGGGRCLPVTLPRSWQRYSLSWRVPKGVDASVVRVVIAGFAGETFDVRRVRLFTPKGELGPLSPQGGRVKVTWGERVEAQAGKSFVPTPEWRTLTVKTNREAGDTLTTTLTTASGLVLGTRNVTVTGPDGAPLPRAPGSNRQTVVFGDPNLAGHTLGTLGLALVSLSGPPLGALGGVLTLLGVALTGSRAALLGVAVGLAWLFWVQLPGGRRRTVFTALGALTAALAGLLWTQYASLPRVFSLSETTARRNIWAAAGEALAAHPWRGLGAGGFPAYWAEQRGGEAVQHAHNLWLEFAASFGVPGLLFALSLSVALSLTAWRAGGARALALVGGVLVMNLFDTTFFYGGVVFTLALTLGTFFRNPLKPSASPLHTPSQQGAHNREGSTGAGMTGANAIGTNTITTNIGSNSIKTKATGTDGTGVGRDSVSRAARVNGASGVGVKAITETVTQSPFETSPKTRVQTRPVATPQLEPRLSEAEVVARTDAGIDASTASVGEGVTATGGTVAGAAPRRSPR